MLVGEIGFPRQEFLHDLRWWEVRSIIRGYNRRHHHGWEQARLTAYNARFCMGSKDPIPTITEWIKFPWEREQDEEDGANGMPTQAEIEQLRREMEAFNSQQAEKPDTPKE